MKHHFSFLLVPKLFSLSVSWSIWRKDETLHRTSARWEVSVKRHCLIHPFSVLIDPLWSGPRWSVWGNGKKLLLEGGEVYCERFRWEIYCEKSRWLTAGRLHAPNSMILFVMFAKATACKEKELERERWCRHLSDKQQLNPHIWNPRSRAAHQMTPTMGCVFTRTF